MLNWYVWFDVLACAQTHTHARAYVLCMWWEKNAILSNANFSDKKLVSVRIVEYNRTWIWMRFEAVRRKHMAWNQCSQSCGTLKWLIYLLLLSLFLFVCWMTAFVKIHNVLFFNTNQISDAFAWQTAAWHSTIHANNDLIRIYFMGFCYIDFALPFEPIGSLPGNSR